MPAVLLEKELLRSRYLPSCMSSPSELRKLNFLRPCAREYAQVVSWGQAFSAVGGKSDIDNTYQTHLTIGAAYPSMLDWVMTRTFQAMMRDA